MFSLDLKRALLFAAALSLLLPPVLGQEPRTPTPRSNPRPAVAVRDLPEASTPGPRAQTAEPVGYQEASTPKPPATARPDTAPTARGPEYVEEKGFKGKVFEVKYRQPGAIMNAIRTLGSGFKGATANYSDDFRTITVRDFPENLATIEEAIKRLDTPQPARADIELHLHVLIASDAASGPDEIPAELTEVVRQLKSTLKYKSYSLMTSSIQRTKDGFPGVHNNGVAESKLFNIERPQGNPIFYSYNLRQVSLAPAGTSGNVVQIDSLTFGMRVPISTDGKNIQYQDVGFGSPVNLREGEKVVVGTTTMADKGLVVVLSAKVLK